ncbi:hypothetical protein X777_05882 [Ooceraea biroi]|uniref:Uncharacterized protein n=1 Tax=Ooceraea biroi TaxID=2015173 RepID=A0A026WDI6_OOCBI|nr:hypothetical protein X777_05882 [Ooceraea biroi]
MSIIALLIVISVFIDKDIIYYKIYILLRFSRISICNTKSSNPPIHLRKENLPLLGLLLCNNPQSQDIHIPSEYRP